MSNQNMIYRLAIGFEVSLAKWRIDDQNIRENREWCLWVFDRNQRDWIPINECKRPGEGVIIRGIAVLEE